MIRLKNLCQENALLVPAKDCSPVASWTLRSSSLDCLDSTWCAGRVDRERLYTFGCFIFITKNKPAPELSHLRVFFSGQHSDTDSGSSPLRISFGYGFMSYSIPSVLFKKFFPLSQALGRRRVSSSPTFSLSRQNRFTWPRVTVSGNKGNAFQVLAAVSSCNLLRGPAGRALSWNLSSRKTLGTFQHSMYSLSLVKPRIRLPT